MVKSTRHHQKYGREASWLLYACDGAMNGTQWNQVVCLIDYFISFSSLFFLVLLLLMVLWALIRALLWKQSTSLYESRSRQVDEHASAIKLMIRTKAAWSLLILPNSLLSHLSFTDLELEELEAPQRYRPDSLAQICKTTKFSESEIKRMYRGFKAHCPNGMVKEDTFKIIYGQFFPQGGSYA